MLESLVTEAVNKAVAEATKKSAATTARVVIKLIAPADAKSVEISLPKAAVNIIADKKADSLT